MRFEELVDGVVTAPELRAAIDEVLAYKRRAPESEYGPRLSAINAYIESELSRQESVAPPVLESPNFEVLDRLLQDTVMRVNSMNKS